MVRLEDTIAKGDVYFIAEMSGNHAGDLSKALDIVAAAAEAGATCLKTQTFTADTITLDADGPDFQTAKGSLWEGRTLHDLYEEAHTPWEWLPVIKEECEKAGMDFISSVFDGSSVDYMDSIGVGAYKIASPELVDLPLIRYAAGKGKPMIISCGMGTEQEIWEAVDACGEAGNGQVVLLKCTSEYPAVYEDMNISTIGDMRERFGCEVGLSDHSLGYGVAVAAAVLGANVIEKHFCLSRREESVDSAFSMEPKEYAHMVEAVKAARASVGTPSYERTEREEAALFGRRSLYAVKSISKGEKFTRENVRSVRPAYGLSPKHLDALIGVRSGRDIGFGERILQRDLEGR